MSIWAHAKIDSGKPRDNQIESSPKLQQLKYQVEIGRILCTAVYVPI